MSIDFRLTRIEQELAEVRRMLSHIHERLLKMPTQADLDAAVAALNDATNAEAAKVSAVKADVDDVKNRIAALQAQLTAAPTVSQATLDELGALTAKLGGSTSALDGVDSTLKGLAADPANPVPAAPTT